jgi:hypothetical protein
MKIHLARLMRDSLPVESSPLPIWNQLINLSGTSKFFSDDPSAADRIVFVDLHQAHHLDIRQTIAQHQLFRDHRHKILVWNEQDRPVFDVRGLYVNVPTRFRLDPTIVPIPYLFVPADSLFYGTNFSQESRTIKCTYRGSNTHKCRTKLLHVNRPDYSLHDATHSNGLTKSDYLAELDNSIHVLCPRGHGLASFRLYESMARGCLPVIISDGWLPPKGIDWDRFCTFVKESDVKYLPNHLNYSGEELLNRQLYLQQAVTTYLAPNVRMNYFLKQISEVPHGNCLSTSRTAKLYNMDFRLRKIVRTLITRFSSG